MVNLTRFESRDYPQAFAHRAFVLLAGALPFSDALAAGVFY
jgi:hypothetical protein